MVSNKNPIGTKADTIENIIIVGHIYIDNAFNYGLGGFLYNQLQKQYPIIGVVKKSFHANDATVVPITRGGSKQQLFVSAIGIDKEIAAQQIQTMHGEFRIPTILKYLDTLTKEA